jgi:hypothetical protein
VGPAGRAVEVRRLDDPEAADVLLPLGEGAVRGEDVRAAGLHHGGRAREMEAGGEDERAGVAHLVVHERRPAGSTSPVTPQTPTRRPARPAD